MASIPSPDITYQPKLPKELIESGAISEVQLEAVVYAGQAHEKFLPPDVDTGVEYRQGWMDGDGTGVGKGRTIAAIILDNFNHGRRKAVWVSKNTALLKDSRDYWEAIGQSPSQIIDFGKIPLGKKVEHQEGVMYVTYGQLKQQGKNDKAGQTRLQQLVDWLGEDFDGALIFDEAHSMSGAAPSIGSRGVTRPSAQGLAGLEIQRRLPKARVGYFTATAATEVQHLAYAERLGLWGRGTEFANRPDFVAKIVDAGVAAMELVSRDLKALGKYLARSLSYAGVKFSRAEHQLTSEQRAVYNQLAEAWQVVLANIDDALNLTGTPPNVRARTMSHFWGTHQRFFNQVITAMQLPLVYREIQKAIDAGKSVVIQLTNTGEASQERALATRSEEDSLEEFDNSPADMLMQMVERSFPVHQYEEYTDENDQPAKRQVFDSSGNPVQNADAVAARDALLDRLGSISVPGSPIDAIVDKFGHENVAEVTGRSRRVILMDDADGRRVRTINSRSKGFSNKAEVAAFMGDKKRILIFSEAGGTGASYHADRNVANQRQRVHILLQAGWKAASAVQGLGRSHRTNQAHNPEFVLVHTDLMGQKRFISTIARRLAQLGALTKGQRETGSNELFTARDNLEGREATDALRQFFRDLHSNIVEGISVEDFERQTGLRLRDSDGQLLDILPPIRSFLNRLLSMKVDQQNAVFNAYDERLQDRIARAEAEGTLDQGIENLRADKVEKVHETAVYTDPATGAQTKYVRLKVYNKTLTVSWEESQSNHPISYVLSNKGNVYAVERTNATRTDDNTGDVHRQIKLRKPSGGALRFIDANKLTAKQYTQLNEEDAKQAWEDAIRRAPEFQTHDVHMITGLVLPIWNRLRGHTRVQRAITTDGESLLGRVISATQVDATLLALGASETSRSAEQPTLTPQQAVATVNGGSTLVLANEWRVKSSLVQGERRIEITGPIFINDKELEGDGVFKERIGFKTRYFLPQGSRAAAVLATITKNRPIVEVTNASNEEIQAYRGQSSTTSKPTEMGVVRVTRGSPEIPATMSGSRTGDNISAHEIVATLSRMFQVPIRSGRVTLKKALGIYKKKPEVVRLMGQASADLAVASHEVAHHIDKTTDVRSGRGLTREMRRELRALDYEPKKARPNEGFAEFIRIYLTSGHDAAYKAAPMFYERFANHWLPANPDMAEKFDRAYALIEQWRHQGAPGRAEASISKTGIEPGPQLPLTERLKEWVSGIYQRLSRNWVDSSYVLKRLDKDVASRNRSLRPGESWSHDLYGALTNAGLGMAARAAREGVVSIRTGEKIGPGLMESLNEIDDAEYPEFRRFLWARHAREVYRKTPMRNPGITREDANWIYNEVEKDTAKFDRYRRAAEGVTEFNRGMLAMLVDAGVIAPQSAQAILNTWETYIPLFRAVSSRGMKGFKGQLVDLPSVVRRRRGSGRQILDPVESTLQQAAVFYDRALRHQVWRQVLDETIPSRGGAEGMGSWVEQISPNIVPTKIKIAEVWPAIAERMSEIGIAADMSLDEDMLKDMGDAFASDWISIWRPDYSSVPGKHIVRDIESNGKPKLYQIDPDLYEAIAGQPAFQIPWFLKVFTAGVKLLKLGAVELNPFFATVNTIGDYQTFQYQSQFTGVNSLYAAQQETMGYIISESARLGYKTGQPDEVVELWREFGGKIASRYGLDRDGLAAMRREIMGHKAKKNIFETLVVHPVNSVREMINVSEVGPRLAEFIGALKDSGYVRRNGRIVHIASNQFVRPPMHVIVKAINAANNVTVNFGRAGRWAHVLNQFIPFFNVAVQGQYSRALTIGGALRGLKRSVKREPLEGPDRSWKRFFLMSAATVAATTAYWWFRHDDDDYKEEEGWLKYFYWTFAWDGKPLVRIRRSYEYNIIPSLTEAILNAYYDDDPDAINEALYNEFIRAVPNIGPALITPAIEVFSNHDFFRNKPIENARLQSLEPGDRSMSYNTDLIKSIGRYLNISPAKLEHFVDAATGGAYRRYYGAAERLAEGRPDIVADNPLAGPFVIKRDYAKSIDAFYTEREKLNQKLYSARLKGESPDELLDRTHTLEDYAGLITEMYEPIRGEQDRDKRFAIEKYIVGLARTAIGREPLDRYPNPLTADAATLPKDVAKMRRDYIARLQKRLKEQMGDKKPTETIEDYQKRRANHLSLRRRTLQQLREISRNSK